MIKRSYFDYGKIQKRCELAIRCPLLMILIIGTAGCTTPEAEQGLNIARISPSNRQTAPADWIQAKDPKLVQPSPAQGAVSIQNPPGFSWSRPQQQTQGYELLLQGPRNQIHTWETTQNWFLPSSRLEPGEYTWKVRPTGSHGQWSNTRSFSISPDAIVFEVPSEEMLLKYIRARTRPRSLSSAEKGTDAPAEVSQSKRRAKQASTIKQLEYRVKSGASKPPVDENSVALVPRSKDEKAWVASLTTIRSRTSGEADQLRLASLLWQLTGQRSYLEEAKRRGNALAALDPGGSTSQANQDQGNRAIAWGLAIAYDCLSDDLSAAQRAAWLGIIKNRAGQIYSDLKSSGWRLAQTPFDSHGATNIGYLAAISALMIGSISEAEQWFRDSFRFYVHYQSPWGGEEGGFANGTAYAEYSIIALLDLWDVIAATTGVNIYEKPWSQGFLKFMACFNPPGSPTFAFGDGAERKPWEEILKAYANRYDNDLALWYSANLTGSPPPLSELTNPISRARTNASGEAPKENSCVFKSIGWVAMHSHWADPKRTSIYFKSSPYAAFNHSHADNNSFVVISEGEPLLIDSGYYDWYGSPHWKGWYWRTKAHNVITFDGGRGQAEKTGPDQMTAAGRLVDFHSNGKVDFAEGDALAAYEGELQKARRRLWYLRDENVLVIHDSLSSAVARQFEWNIHSINTFEIKAAASIETKGKTSRACIDVLQPSGIEFLQSNKFEPPPQGVAKSEAQFIPEMKDQWHGKFRNKQRQTDMEFLAVVRPGCSDVPLNANDFTSRRQIVIGKTRIDIPR
jgi:hypothetical protein